MAEIDSLHHWYRTGPLAAAPQVHRIAAPEAPQVVEAGPVCMVNLLCPAGAVPNPPVPEWAVYVVLRTPPLLQLGFNRRPRWLVMSPGVMLVAPPDTDGEFITDSESHVLTMTIPRARVEDFSDAAGARVGIRREEAFREPRIQRRLIRLWHALAEDEAGTGPLFADEVMGEVLDMLARRTDGRPVRQARERLSGPRVRRLRDYVETCLADELDVATMARVAAMSPAHFARAFSATVGMTPFRYVMTRRLARARELLDRTERSVLAIALTVGFKTPSHFAARFRREFGVTPQEIRPDTRRRDERTDLGLVAPRRR